MQKDGLYLVVKHTEYSSWHNNYCLRHCVYSIIIMHDCCHNIVIPTDLELIIIIIIIIIIHLIG